MGPVLWNGGCALRVATISLILLLIISQLFGIVYPLVFKTIIDSIVCTSKSKKGGVRKGRSDGGPEDG